MSIGSPMWMDGTYVDTSTVVSASTDWRSYTFTLAALGSGTQTGLSLSSYLLSATSFDSMQYTRGGRTGGSGEGLTTEGSVVSYSGTTSESWSETGSSLRGSSSPVLPGRLVGTEKFLRRRR